jgi:uncharacterized protein YfaS (alpha-2-macroglobulin family)
VRDAENQTAYLNLRNSNYWWYWYGSEHEAHAYYLKLLSRTDPSGEKASGLVKYLLNNRKHATYWNSTRDTAVIVEAFADYLAASGEAAPDLTLDIFFNDKKMKTVRINAENLFTFDNQFILEGKQIPTGTHTITLKKSGKGPVYFNAYLDYFTLEDFITKAGLEIKVQRRVFRLKEVDFEPVEVRSGYTDNEMGAYVEFRDQKVAFFVRRLARGKHSVSYRLRAEIPGKFSALPTRAYAMYAPELKANSDEIKLIIKD